MNDKEINIALAKAMGYEVLTFPLDGPVQNGEITVAKDNVNKRMVMVDYKDPAISLECIGWLTDNNQIIIKDDNHYFIKDVDTDLVAGVNENGFKAVALAVIGLKKELADE